MLRGVEKLVVLALFSAAVTFAADGPVGPIRINLRERALVEGERIRLSDVAVMSKGSPSGLSALALGNAPWLGSVRKVTRELVALRLASVGLQPSDYSLEGSLACLVERRHERIDPQTVVDAARQYLESRFAEVDADLRIELLKELRPIIVATGPEPLQFVSEMAGSGPPAGRVRVDVSIVRGDTRLKAVPVSFAVRLFKQVAVAAKNIARGEEIARESISLARRDITYAQGPCVEHPDDLVGQVALHAIHAGQFITLNMVRQAQEPVVIDFNQRIFLVVESATLRIITVGRSLSRARRGEPASAKNLETGRVVTGIASGNGTLKVSFGEALDGSW